jgi:hypothetical protein
MSRTGRLAVACLLGLLLAEPLADAAPAPADKSALAQVPASAPLVLHLHGVQGTLERLVAFLDAAAPDLSARLKESIADVEKKGFDEGRRLKGLAKEGPIFVVFPDLPKGPEPKVAVILAVTDYAAFRDGLLHKDERAKLKKEEGGFESVDFGKEGSRYFIERKGYAVVTTDKGLAAEMAKKQPGLDEKIGKEQGERLLTSDFGIYFNMDVLGRQYADHIKEARKAVEEALKGVNEVVPGNLRDAQQAVGKVIGPIFQAVEDSRGVLLTAEFRPAGLALHLDSEFRPGSVSAKNLADIKGAPLVALDNLPPGQMIYSGVALFPALRETLDSLLFSVSIDPQAKEAKAVHEAVGRMLKARPGRLLDARSEPAAGVQVWAFADHEAGAAAMLDMIRALPAGAVFSNGILKDKPVVAEGVRKHRNYTLHEVKLTWDIDKLVEQAGKALGEKEKKQLREAFEKTLGKGMTLWVGPSAAGNLVVQVFAADWETARKLLDEWLDGQKMGVGAVDAAYRDIRKELPAANLVVLRVADPVRLAATMGGVLRPFLWFPLPDDLPVGPRQKPSYFAGALSVGPERVAVDVVLTRQACKDLYETYWPKKPK